MSLNTTMAVKYYNIYFNLINILIFISIRLGIVRTRLQHFMRPLKIKKRPTDRFRSFELNNKYIWVGGMEPTILNECKMEMIITNR